MHTQLTCTSIGKQMAPFASDAAHLTVIMSIDALQPCEEAPRKRQSTGCRCLESGQDFFPGPREVTRDHASWERDKLMLMKASVWRKCFSICLSSWAAVVVPAGLLVACKESQSAHNKQ